MLQNYLEIMQSLSALLEAPIPPVSALSNAAALLWHHLPNLNWAGFYLYKEDCLYLGPFQGKPACQVIQMGRGVCGTAAQQRCIQRVPNVHEFPGHIACDAASQSEIVLPLIKAQTLLGVMDLDSPQVNRFSSDDEEGLSRICQILMTQVDWSHGIL